MKFLLHIGIIFREGRMNIAGAYPREAGITSLHRCLCFVEDEVTLTDVYTFEDEHSLTLSLYTPALVEKEADRIKLWQNKAELNICWEQSDFTEVCIDTVLLEDEKLQASWGKSLRKITFTTKKTAKDSYKLTFNRS